MRRHLRSIFLHNVVQDLAEGRVVQAFAQGQVVEDLLPEGLAALPPVGFIFIEGHVRSTLEVWRRRGQCQQSLVLLGRETDSRSGRLVAQRRCHLDQRVQAIAELLDVPV